MKLSALLLFIVLLFAFHLFSFFIFLIPMFVDRYVSWKVSLRANDTRISKYLNYSILFYSILFLFPPYSSLFTLFSLLFSLLAH